MFNVFTDIEAIVYIDRLKEVCLRINQHPGETSHVHNATFRIFFLFCHI